eukprot:3100526-Amphidinium_carterae.1
MVLVVVFCFSANEASALHERVGYVLYNQKLSKLQRRTQKSLTNIRLSANMARKCVSHCSRSHGKKFVRNTQENTMTSVKLHVRCTSLPALI